MPLHVAIDVNCETGANTYIKVQVPSIRAKMCMLDNYACET